MNSSSTNIPMCLFCNCSSSCSLGQGDLICIQSSSSSPSSQPSIPPHSTRTLDDIPPEKREHFLLETGKILVPVDAELLNVGFTSPSDLSTEGNLWVHERCLKWSIPNLDTPYDYDLIRTQILNAAKEKCTICDRYGASLICRNDGCPAKFHLPCAQSSGSFFCHSQWSFLCPQHVDAAVSLFGADLSSCEVCSEPGDVRGQLFCTNCDKHYHADCLILEANRVVRTGWRCPDCKICQTCRQAGDDAEMIMCNVCDKGYHTFCLRNQSIPKDGWSCPSCLSLTTKTSSTVKSICSLCQNEILSKQLTRQCHLCQVRIHSSCHSIPDDYYDDDSAYICRSCSISSSTTTLPMDEGDEDDEPNKEIYRSSSNSKINRLISRSQKSNPSPLASPSSAISTRKRRSVDYSQQSSLEYTSGGGDSSEMTTGMIQQDPPFIFESLSSIKDESSEHSMDLPLNEPMTVPVKVEEEQPQSSKTLRAATSQRSGKGKPMVESRTYGGEISKKRARRALNNGHRRASSPQSSSSTAPTTALNPTRSGTTTGTGLRGRPPKIRKEIQTQSSTADEMALIPMNALNTSTGSTGSTYTVGAVKRDDDEHHAVTVLCASDELYTLGQDMCVSCGSFGCDEEGRLISCTQCGQSYHTYCAGLNKLSKVILKQGWRCLDCTVCEGCGKPTDESRLLLCDDCDISYHTYCLQPPLDQVPKGNWKCQWCVRCVKCGSTTPGPAGSMCAWENNYTECSPCYSLVQCPVCSKAYRTDDLIVQCTICDRWLHGSCEHILSEDSTLSTPGDFICSLCRPTAAVTSTNELPIVAASPKSSSPSDQAPLLVVTTTPTPINPPVVPQPQLPTPKATKLDEGVHLTDTGLAQLKSIRVKPLPKKANAAATAQANNAKMKRAGLVNSMMGGIKRNNSNSIQDDDTMGNNTTGAGSGTSDDEGTKKNTATVPTTKAAKGYTGIGGFHVKIRGPRRRQDQSSSQNDPNQEENAHDESLIPTKRRRDRRPLKKKSMLEEQMPPEMQEAFFGIDLAERSRLMAQHHPNVNSLQLNDQSSVMNNQNNEYTIKLDHDTVNRFLIKKATKLALTVKEEQRPAPVTPAPAPSAPLPPPPPPAIPTTDDADEMPGILDTDEFSDFVEYVMGNSKTTQDPMLPLLGGPTDIEDFLDFIEHPESHNELQAVDLLNNSNTESQNTAMETGSNLVQVIQSHQTTMINSTNPVHHPNNPPGPLQTPTSNLVVMATNVIDNSKQIINNLAREMMESTGLHTTTTSSILAQSTITNTNLIVKQEYHDHPHNQGTMIIPQQPNWPQQPPNTIRIHPMPQAAPSSLTPSSTTPNQDRSGTVTTEHANLMERTREDEQLGQNATMSNVLYCNVNHPDLKQQFPVYHYIPPYFNERFKQMKKIWRKVPTDAKQHYTQQARLNRTKRRALKSSNSQSSNASKGGKRKNSSKQQQQNESEDANNDGGAGSESRSSTPSSSATNETTTVIVHPNEHQEHPPPHLYQQPRPMYSPSSGNLMVTTPTNPGNFHHQPYQTPQRQGPPMQQGYGTPVSAPAGYPPPQRFSFPPQQTMQPTSAPGQPSQNSPYFDYAPSTPRPLLHQPSSSAESTPIHHPLNPNANNPIRKSNSSSDPNTPYHHVSPMDDASPYYQQQSPYGNPNAMKGPGTPAPAPPQVQQQNQPPILPRGMPPRPPQSMQRFPSQDGNNFVRTPSAIGTPGPGGQPARFIFTSPSNQGQQQATHYVQYTTNAQGQHTVVVQQGSADGFQRMPESPVHQHMQQQGPHHQPSPQFSPHHHPMTPNAQTHSMHLPPQPTQQQQQQQPPQPGQPQSQHMSPYASQPQQQPPPSQQQQPSMHYIHPQHSPTIVIQPTSQFSPSSVHHHQLTLNNNNNTSNNPGHQSPPNDPTKRQIQMQKPAQQVLVKHEPMNFEEQNIKAEPHEDSLNESMNSTKSRSDPLQSVPPHVLEQIDEVINEVVSGAGVIPQDVSNAHPPSLPVQLVSLPQSKLPTQHLIAHPSYPQQPNDWSNFPQQQQPPQQQPTLNIAAMRGPPSYPHYHPQGQGQVTNSTNPHDLLPATTNVINTVGVPQHEQQQIVAERISSILSSTTHDQQGTTTISSNPTATTATTPVPQAPIQIKRTWTMNPHGNNESHYLASNSTDPSISLEDLLERDYKDKQQQQQQQQPAVAITDWAGERPSKPSASNSTSQQAPLSLAHAVHLLQQAITHPLYQQNPPPELTGLISVGRDNDGAGANATFNEEQFERYARWLKQRREINSLRIKADETNLADIKKKRNILMKKQKQSLCTPEEEQEMPRLSQQQTEYSRTLTAMRKEKKQFDELEQAFLVYKQSRLNALYPAKSSPAQLEQQQQQQQTTEPVVRVMSMNNLPSNPMLQTIQRPISEQMSTMVYTSSSSTTNLDEHEELPTDDPSSLSPHDPSSKTMAFMPTENASFDSTSMPVTSTTTMTTATGSSIEQSNSSPANHEYEPSHTSSTSTEQEQESMESHVQSNSIEQ